MRYVALSALVLCALAAQAIPQKDAASPAPQKSAARKIPCKTPDNASMCYWTRGRLNFYEGNPSYRIWKVGTKRILGIYSGPAVMPRSAEVIVKDGEDPEFPGHLDGVFEAEYKRRVSKNSSHVNLIDPVFADYEICPLEPEREGEMQASCVESARHVVVQRWVADRSTAVTYPDTY
jgi:hypothetical protein